MSLQVENKTRIQTCLAWVERFAQLGYTHNPFRIIPPDEVPIRPSIANRAFEGWEEFGGNLVEHDFSQIDHSDFLIRLNAGTLSEGATSEVLYALFSGKIVLSLNVLEGGSGISAFSVGIGRRFPRLFHNFWIDSLDQLADPDDQTHVRVQKIIEASFDKRKYRLSLFDK